jgi:hypothetical protein
MGMHCVDVYEVCVCSVGMHGVGVRNVNMPSGWCMRHDLSSLGKQLFFDAHSRKNTSFPFLYFAEYLSIATAFGPC